MSECGCGELGHDEFCEQPIGANLDEHEPRKPFPPPEASGDTLPDYTFYVPPMPVPREMRDTVAPKRGLAGDSATRKSAPVYEGFMCYWPNAIAEVARFSKFGNDKHNKGEDLHWSFNKSTDHGDCLARHELEAEEIDPSTITEDNPDGFLHAVAVAWRAMAQLETLLLKRHPELRPGKNVRGIVR